MEGAKMPVMPDAARHIIETPQREITAYKWCILMMMSGCDGRNE
jgi:hypothetical protein